MSLLHVFEIKLISPPQIIVTYERRQKISLNHVRQWVSFRVRSCDENMEDCGSGFVFSCFLFPNCDESTFFSTSKILASDLLTMFTSPCFCSTEISFPNIRLVLNFVIDLVHVVASPRSMPIPLLNEEGDTDTFKKLIGPV